MMLRRYSAVLLVIALLLGILPATTTEAANNVKVKPVSVNFDFDGNVLQPPAGQFAFVYKGTTYIPLRFVSYALQKNVQWNGKSSKVTISDPTASQLVVIKEKLLNLSSQKVSNSSKAILMTPVKVDYVFNGKAKVLPEGLKSFMYKGTLYVPVRFVAESAGSVITWDSKTKTVKGTSASHQQEQNNEQKPNTDHKEDSSTLPSQPTKPTNPTSPPASGNGTGKVSYETITSSTEAKLESLQAESQSTLMNLAKQYLAASSEASKKELLAQGQQQLNSLSAKFENIVGNAESQLKDNGYSTDIINQYRKAFNDEIEAGKQLADGLAG